MNRENETLAVFAAVFMTPCTINLLTKRHMLIVLLLGPIASINSAFVTRAVTTLTFMQIARFSDAVAAAFP